MNNQPTAVLYLRVSRDEQVRAALSGDGVRAEGADGG